MLDYCVRFEIDGSHLPTRSRRRNYYGLNAQYTVYDSCLPSIWKKKVKPSTNDWVPPGVDEVYVSYLVARGEVFDAYPAAEEITSSICPVETRLLVLEGITGDDCPVVAADSNLGNIAQGCLLVEFLTFLFCYRTFPLNVDDLVVLNNHYYSFVADNSGDFTCRLAVFGFVWTCTDLPGGEVRELWGALASTRMQDSILPIDRFVIRYVEMAGMPC